MKLTKIEVRYEHPAKGMDECKDCKYFLTPDRCRIVEGTIQPNGWCERFEEKKMAHAGHGFHSTHIELHDDGSATIHHVHEKGPEHDKKYAAADLDGVHDGLEDHLRMPEAEEEKLEEQVHPGIHKEIMEKAEEGE